METILMLTLRKEGVAILMLMMGGMKDQSNWDDGDDNDKEPLIRKESKKATKKSKGKGKYVPSFDNDGDDWIEGESNWDADAMDYARKLQKIYKGENNPDFDIELDTIDSRETSLNVDKETSFSVSPADKIQEAVVRDYFQISEINDIKFRWNYKTKQVEVRQRFLEVGIAI